jgi:GntR family transcriptional regulator
MRFHLTGELTMTLDRTSPLPLYHQLKQILLQKIQSLDVGSGKPLPSRRDTTMYGVSLSPTSSLGELKNEGYVSRQPGRGTFALRPKLQDQSQRLGGFTDDLKAQGYNVSSRILAYAWSAPPAIIAKKLGLGSERWVRHLKRIVFADGEPIGLSQGWFTIPENVTFSNEELAKDSIYPLLERKYGIIIRRANKTIEATLALEDEAALSK